jgi:hypothetical protein
VPEGVVPPDAPPRETSDADAAKVKGATAPEAKAEAPKKKRGRPKKKKTEDAPEAAEAPKAKTAGMTIYVGCMPMRTDVEPTLFEDWIAPVLEACDGLAQSVSAVESWYLLGFGPQKALLAAKVQEWVNKGLPPVMLVQNPSPLWTDVSTVLAPYATQIVRSFR